MKTIKENKTMKLTVGIKSVIARNIGNFIHVVISSLLIYVYLTFHFHVADKYNRTIIGVFSSNYHASSSDQLLFAILLVIALISILVLLDRIYELIISVHYFKKYETTISEYKIIQQLYYFPYSKKIKSITINNITEVDLIQSSIERLFECGSIRIKGYTNANYSKTKFTILIEGIDSVLEVRNDIIDKFNVD